MRKTAMYDDQIVPLEGSDPLASVPDHLLGTRAALFHLLDGRSDDDITISKPILAIDALAKLKPIAEKSERYSIVLSVDDFVFCSDK